MERIVLIDGRFELLNRPERLDVFDIRNLQRDSNGCVNPIVTIPLNNPITDLEAGKLALAWLRESKYLEQSEYFQFLEIFLASQPNDEAAAIKEALRNELRSISRNN